jgi:hypothetical protein
VTDSDDRETALRREHPGWDIWHGVASLCYARLRKSSPPVIVRAHNWTVLAERIRIKEAGLRGRP